MSNKVQISMDSPKTHFFLWNIYLRGKKWARKLRQRHKNATGNGSQGWYHTFSGPEAVATIWHLGHWHQQECLLLMLLGLNVSLSSVRLQQANVKKFIFLNIGCLHVSTRYFLLTYSCIYLAHMTELICSIFLVTKLNLPRWERISENSYN